MRGRGRPVTHNPDWTEHRESDPGITLVQLFAFLAVAIGAVAIAWRLVRESTRRSGSAVPDGSAGTKDVIEPRSEDRGSGGGGGSRTPVP